MSDLRILAQTVRGEAEGESWDGKLAVAYVPINRAALKREHFGVGVAGCCVKPKQFSCWNEGSNRLKAMRLMDEAFVRSYEVTPEHAAASTALTRSLPDPTGGATHYHTVANILRLEVWPPAWASSPQMVPTVRIGGHAFYRED